MPTFRASERYFLLDDARTCSTMEALQRQLQFLKNSGFSTIIWHFSDDQGCRIRFESLPQIGESPSFTTADVRKLVCFARNIGLTLIPELASLGHSRYITRLPEYEHLNENLGAYSGMCPVHPQTREIFAKLLRETIEIFDPPAVHVGMDEVDIGQHPVTAAAMKTQSAAQLVAEHLTFLRQIVIEEAGREMWIWGDGLLADPQLMELTPKDLIVCNWQYRPTATLDTTQQLLDAGFEVIVASGILSHDQTVLPSNDYALRNIEVMQSHLGLSPKVRGHIVTTWIPCRSVGESQYLGWHLAADLLDGRTVEDRPSAIAKFGREFYSLAVTNTFVTACQALLARFPQRGEWMSTLKLTLDFDYATMNESLHDRAAAYQKAAEQLRAIRKEVAANGDAYDAFQLIADLLAHAYTAAEYIESLENGAAVRVDRLQTLLERRRKLIADVSAAWDRERFANDPAKWQPVIHFFRDDHLLVVMRNGLEELERRWSTARASESIALPVAAASQSVA